MVYKSPTTDRTDNIDGKKTRDFASIGSLRVAAKKLFQYQPDAQARLFLACTSGWYEGI